MALNVGYFKSIQGILKILEVVSMQPLELKESVIVTRNQSLRRSHVTLFCDQM